MSPITAGGTAQSSEYVSNKTAASFIIHNTASVPRTFNWFAIGV
jgi:hypothetical protein